MKNTDYRKQNIDNDGCLGEYKVYLLYVCFVRSVYTDSLARVMLRRIRHYRPRHRLFPQHPNRVSPRPLPGSAAVKRLCLGLKGRVCEGGFQREGGLEVLLR